MVGVVIADSESLRAANAIDTPEETVPGTTFTINHLGAFEQGEDIEATVTGPDDTYDIGLFDSSDTEVAEQTDVDETVTFDSTELEPGSYMLQVTNTAFGSIAPIVISGYDVDVDLTENAAESELTVDATVTETELQGEPHNVEAFIWNDDRETRTELTLDEEFSSSGEYEGAVSIDEFDGESYNVYVVAVSENEIQGENEILAVGEADSDDTGGSDDGSNDTGGSDDGSNDTGGSDDGSNDTDEATDDDPSVIEPDTSSDEDDATPSDDDSQDDDVPVDDIDDETPLSMVLTVVALLLTSLGIARLAN